MLSSIPSPFGGGCSTTPEAHSPSNKWVRVLLWESRPLEGDHGWALYPSYPTSWAVFLFNICSVVKKGNGFVCKKTSSGGKKWMKILGILKPLSPTNESTPIPTTSCDPTQQSLAFECQSLQNRLSAQANSQMGNHLLLVLLNQLIFIIQNDSLKMIFLFKYVMHFDNIHSHCLLPLVP